MERRAERRGEGGGGRAGTERQRRGRGGEAEERETAMSNGEVGGVYENCIAARRGHSELESRSDGGARTADSPGFPGFPGLSLPARVGQRGEPRSAVRQRQAG